MWELMKWSRKIDMDIDIRTILKKKTSNSSNNNNPDKDSPYYPAIIRTVDMIW